MKRLAYQCLVVVGCVTAVLGCGDLSNNNDEDAIVEQKLASVSLLSVQQDEKIILPIQAKRSFNLPNDLFAAPFLVRTKSSAKTDTKLDTQADKPPSTPASEHKISTPYQPTKPSHQATSVLSQHPLQSYDLHELHYQGYLQKDGQMIALVVLPNGRAYAVTVGQYLGVQRAKITAITQKQMVLLSANDEAIVLPFEVNSLGR
ncbi:pilus assembly protein PilP [Moraxella nasovis]|uniref:pilus assembly protein PilP n=1 Tax=Moraxella nasovis TaxID=2904121 RepID=UPI001F6102BE|nr:pilus assembly protein PilP [Moraxella nasovis]UNU72859.1 pilus assembly protein PilP [Moraxella nasovis]